jgi:hypothetical protein
MKSTACILIVAEHMDSIWDSAFHKKENEGNPIPVTPQPAKGVKDHIII